MSGGVQYASVDYRQQLKIMGMKQSISAIKVIAGDSLG
jgi:hypothetical protein